MKEEQLKQVYCENYADNDNADLRFLEFMNRKLSQSNNSDYYLKNKAFLYIIKE